MALIKAVKLEVLITTENEMSDAEIKDWAHKAMLTFCDFRTALVTITEKHENILEETVPDLLN